ncbi:MAG: hypothetical protein QOF14_3745 [Hyphomicrobiales bacterium]|nr:hypothetical protein [Hyphomicrobiales bacterium]
MYGVALEFFISFGIVLGLIWLIARWWRRKSASARLTRASEGGAEGPVQIRVARLVTSTDTKSSRPAKAASRSDARWVSPGEQVKVGGVTIDGGLFYFGRSLPAQSGYGDDNALIDGTLPIGNSPGNVSGQGVPYYPSYSRLDAGSRRAFIDWLAGARSDPTTYIGYVFIYFYGLERRLFYDLATDQFEPIVAEVTRLLRIYGDNGSFRSYASRFLDCAAAMVNAWPTTPWLDPSAKSPEVPLRLRGAIGAILKRSQTIGDDWALAWYASSPEYTLRTPAVRCFPEFVTLFRSRFATKFPGGLSVRPPRRKLSARYQAASGAFAVDLHGDFRELPDIVALTAPLTEIDRIVAECTEALEPYSRLLGRDASARGTLAAELALPKELMQNPKSGSRIADLKRKIESRVTGTSGMVPFGELLSLLQVDVRAGEKVKKRETIELVTALENLGFAMEPDPRQGGPIPTREAEVMLFRHHGQDTASSQPSADFLVARSHVEIAVLVSSVDGNFGGQEARAIISQIKAVPALSDVQRARLIGYLGYLVRNPPGSRILNRFKERSLDERRALASIAVLTAGADGQLTIDEVKVLERTYGSLNLPKEELYRQLNAIKVHDQASTIEDEPPLVARGVPSRGIPIPPRPITVPPAGGLKLDMRRVAKIQADTAIVKTILGEVFSESDEKPEKVTPAQSPGQSVVAKGSDIAAQFPGLERRHALLLGEISDRDAIEQAVFADLARKQSLLPAGAIETINDWAFERYGEGILDNNGEPIEIAHHLLRSPEVNSASEHVT